MIDERLERMKRKHNCRVYFDADSFQISDCTVAPVHDIPDVIHENQEFDYSKGFICVRKIWFSEIEES